jgi:hypothetical protein
MRRTLPVVRLAARTLDAAQTDTLGLTVPVLGHHRGRRPEDAGNRHAPRVPLN